MCKLSFIEINTQHAFEIVLPASPAYARTWTSLVCLIPSVRNIYSCRSHSINDLKRVAFGNQRASL